jgi:PTS system nitrogen regulatory IIA component
LVKTEKESAIYRSGVLIMETMDIDALAAYLRRDVREVGKLANRGHLPGRKVAGEWRFARAEINHWLETQLAGYTEDELAGLEEAHRAGDEPLLAGLLSPDTVAVPLPASTRASVLKELVTLAERSWQVYDPDAIHEAIKAREEMASTALPSGVAIPHPHRPLTQAVVAFGRTGREIPFGAPRGGLTDLFFLVACRDDRTHLRVMARLARLFLRPGFLDALRGAEGATEAHELIIEAERELPEKE